jgi:hypothetical protein
MAQRSKLQRRLRTSHVGATMCEIASSCQHKMRRANTAKDKPETTMTRFFIAGIAALFLATGAAHATVDSCAVVLRTPDGFLTLRKAPSVKAKIIARLKPGDILLGFESLNATAVGDKWAHVLSVPQVPRLKNESGWVRARFIVDVECKDLGYK